MSAKLTIVLDLPEEVVAVLARIAAAVETLAGGAPGFALPPAGVARMAEEEVSGAVAAVQEPAAYATCGPERDRAGSGQPAAEPGDLTPPPPAVAKKKRNVSPEWRAKMIENAARMRAAKAAKLAAAAPPLPPEPAPPASAPPPVARPAPAMPEGEEETDFATIRAWAAPRGIAFDHADDLAGVNAKRRALFLRPFRLVTPAMRRGIAA